MEISLTKIELLTIIAALDTEAARCRSQASFAYDERDDIRHNMYCDKATDADELRGKLDKGMLVLRFAEIL